MAVRIYTERVRAQPWFPPELGEPMRDAVIVEAVRTPVGKRNGGLSGVHPVDLSAHVLNALVERSGHRPGARRRRHLGLRQRRSASRRFDIARTAVLAAGWPETVPGVTVDRQCGSSPAGGALRRGRAHRRAVRRRRRRRRRVDEPGADGLARSPRPAARSAPQLPRPLRRRVPQPGRRRRDDRRAVGLLPHAARRVLPRLAREGRRRAGRGPVRRRRSPRSPCPTAP